MRRPAALALAVASAVLASPARPAAAAEDPLEAIERRQQALFEKIGPSVVFLSAIGSFGSGFLVGGEQRLILTSAHVVPMKDQKVDVVLADGRTFVGTVIERGAADTDLALVALPEGADRLPPGLPLAPAPDLRVGSWVAAVGHGKGGIWSFNTGMVSNIYPDGADRPVFQTQIPLNPGNSGGPVVDRQGRVVGVVTASMRNSQNMNFAIRIEVALRTLSRLSVAAPVLTVIAPDGVPVFVDGKMAGTGPRVVVPAVPRTYEVFAVIGGAMKKLRVAFPAQTQVELK